MATRLASAPRVPETVRPTKQAQALGLRAHRQRQARDEQPIGRRLNPAEVRVLRRACDRSTRKGKRDLATLDAILYAGLRLENLRQDGGRWWSVLAGKGRKTRRVKVHDALCGSPIPSPIP